MKVTFRLKGVIESIYNVGMDDKCYPLVGGVHPYSQTSRYSSPLTQKSAIWFKTLALSALYIDCDRGHIFWAPVTDTVAKPSKTTDTDSDTQSVRLRPWRKSTYQADPDFIKEEVKPLFNDWSLYDLDSSFREMMGKCCDIVKKFYNKTMKTKEFHNLMANLLHVYIFPTITFSEDELFALSRARCLVEERLDALETRINFRTEVIGSHANCLIGLKTDFLQMKGIDTEPVLRGFSEMFLSMFLQTIKDDVSSKNFELLSAQEKVNWAKKQGDDPLEVREMQAVRNKLFEEVKFLIRVREALTNVLKEDLETRSLKMDELADRCFQNIYMELTRWVRLETGKLEILCADKVNICATREAILMAVDEIDEGRRDSARSTTFMPDDIADYHLGTIEVGDQWLTFDERVSKILENPDSTQSKIHKQGCGFLQSQIDVALSEFKLTMVGQEQVTAESPPLAHRRTGVLLTGGEKDEFTLLPSAQAVKQIQALSRRDQLEGDFRLGSQTLDSLNFFENHFNDEPEQVADDGSNSSEVPKVEAGNNVGQAETSDTEVTMRRKKKKGSASHMSPHAEFLAFRAMMTAVDRIKLLTHSHFSDVIQCFLHDLTSKKTEVSVVCEQRELSWKAYERFFCQEVLNELLELYSTALVPASSDAHTALSSSSLHNLLEGDKLLDLIFGHATATVPDIPNSPSVCSTTSSLARTISGLSLEDMRHCSLADLYNIANKDSSRICDRMSRHPEAYPRPDLSTVLSGSDDSLAVTGLMRDEGIESNWSGPSNTSTLERDAKCSELRDSSIEVDISSESQGDASSQDTDESACVADEEPACVATDRSECVDTKESLCVATDESACVATTSDENRGNSTTLCEPEVAVSAETLDYTLDGSFRGTDESSCLDNCPVTSALSPFTLLELHESHSGSTVTSTQVDAFFKDPESENRQSTDQVLNEAKKSLEKHSLIAELQARYSEFVQEDGDKAPIAILQPLLSTFVDQVKKCVGAKCLLDKVRYASRAVLELHSNFSDLYDSNYQSACDDIITMLVLGLSQLTHELFVGFYINLRLVTDILPSFLSGTLWEYNLVCVVAAYDFLFSKNVCSKVARRFPSSFSKHE